ncbi:MULTISPECIES: aldehyde dehydrogenase family protein [Rhizobium]|uniref:Aldehyde dehydrogenase family protein n=1 Tax=Rhizobium tropici TaxID=398 RepID=A0A6P1CGX9_RHITR|nr:MULTISPECIES: aldehyde dehydrogenase family protein [Rhizobium]AGB72704.1 gamma-glutamyl-gamma-aminobutyraldehyde dehydrogenase [Rhizobium tropici CIAT 899]MBB4240997.1 gamma-glutamyl-gamma-aminobutyraldehyde dehydrogenase [Rhizobium tropici]MBB5592456.1 gamma-glutamyl-gamma-aminobutyraldehyde dehydrogenase [Rhizobium tropici]MBB6491322.1 gamma-glutamyl-gamma-aminobutyraldehyde dehydrogenase [Rhizobium tropici]NEV14054.1 aldehyde dehydrogenase family protein [Rhizobium tropici]
MTKNYTRDYWENVLSGLKPEGRHFINGVHRAAASGETFTRIRPMDGKPGAELARGNAADVDAAVASARAAFESGVWRKKEPLEKKKIMLKWADLIRANGDELAMLETIDVGKPVMASLGVDVRLCADGIQFYGEMIDKLYDEIAPTGSNARALVRKVPLGVIGAITPWNYPMIIDAWKLGPAIAAGNSVVLKPAEQSSLSAIRLAELAIEAGLPAGVFNVVTGYGEETGKPLALHMDVDMIAFTGSTEVGKLIMGYAAQSNVKRVALELGGKSPLVVFEDADLDAAAVAAAWGCFYNSGETCHASTRLIVQRSVQDRLIEKIEAVTRSDIALKHPLDPAAQIGALIEEEHMNKVLAMIAAGEKEGARRAFGAERVLNETGGYYVSPGVFVDMTNDMSLARQEIFGPVLAAIPFDTEEEALKIANDTIYGLAGAVFTKDMDRAHRFSEEIHAGTVWINTYDMSNFATPFGGFKQSGFGRDRSVHAIDKYCDYKTIWQQFG